MCIFDEDLGIELRIFMFERGCIFMMEPVGGESHDTHTHAGGFEFESKKITIKISQPRRVKLATYIKNKNSNHFGRQSRLHVLLVILLPIANKAQQRPLNEIIRGIHRGCDEMTFTVVLAFRWNGNALLIPILLMQ